MAHPLKLHHLVDPTYVGMIPGMSKTPHRGRVDPTYVGMIRMTAERR